MILTRDNILRYIKEKKAVTPTMIAEDFETTTMIASAALSELSKDKLINITYLKLSSSPYYYDPKQSSILIELGNKHLKNYEKEVFLKLKESEVINASSLNIQESLAVERIKDFARPLEININGKNLKFWIWYQRNFDETKKQIFSALNPLSKNDNISSKENLVKKEKKKQEKKQVSSSNINSNSYVNNNLISKENNSSIKTKINSENIRSKPVNNSSVSNNDNNNKNNEIGGKVQKDLVSKSFQPKESFANKIESFIENYFKENYLVMQSKQREEKGISYNVKLIVNKIEIDFDCFYFKKKPTDADVIKFYSSSIKPKLVFIENVPKKLFKLSSDLENLNIINI